MLELIKGEINKIGNRKTIWKQRNQSEYFEKIKEIHKQDRKMQITRTKNERRSATNDHAEI